MTTVRSNPLPQGRYWIDVFRPTPTRQEVKDNVPAIEEWIAANRGAVAVEKREVFRETSPVRYWYLFRVQRAPTDFPFKALGFPTVAKPDVTTSSQTATNAAQTAPQGATPSLADNAAESLSDSFESLSAALKKLPPIILILGIGALLWFTNAPSSKEDTW